MAKFNTVNPLGSTDPRDFLDNATIADHYIDDTDSESWPDRFGRARRTWHGIEMDSSRQLSSQEDRFQQFLLSSDYVILPDYVDGPVTFTARNQITAYNGEFFRPKAGVSLPYTTSGTSDTAWGVDKNNFVTVGDASLRQEVYSVITPITGLKGGQENGLSDSLIIQEVLANGNKTVIFPRGNYYVQIPLHVYPKTRVIIPPGTTLFNDIRLTNAPKYFSLDTNGYAEPVFINAEHGNQNYSYGYNGDGNIIIEGGGKIDGIERIKRAEYCSSIKISHAENIQIRDIIFENQYRSHFIELNSTRKGRITGCRFGYIEKNGGGASYECINIDYSLKGNYPHSGGWDGTPCQDIVVDNNTSHANECLVGSHTADTSNPHTDIMVYANRGYPSVKSSDGTTYNNGGCVKALNWKRAQIFNNNWLNATVIQDFIRTEACDQISVMNNRLNATDTTTAVNQSGIFATSNTDMVVSGNYINAPISNAYRLKNTATMIVNNNVAKLAYQYTYYFESVTNLVFRNNHFQWNMGLLSQGYTVEFKTCNKISISGLTNEILDSSTAAYGVTCTMVIRACTNVYELNYGSIQDFPSTFYKSSGGFKEIKVVKAGNSLSMVLSSDDDIQCLGNNEVLYYSSTSSNTVTSLKLTRSILNYHSLTIYCGANTTGNNSVTLDLVQSYGDTINADNVLYLPFSPTIDATTGVISYKGTKVTISSDGLTLNFSTAVYVRAVVANKDGYSSYSS